MNTQTHPEYFGSTSRTEGAANASTMTGGDSATALRKSRVSNYRFLLIAAALLLHTFFVANPTQAGGTKDLRMTILCGQALERAREAFNNGDSNHVRLVEELAKQADIALERRPTSVTQKTVVSPSGNPNDYVSIGIYWWPDPTKEDGLPWIRRDGEVNPMTREGGASDSGRIEDLENDVFCLALAWFF